MLNHALPLIYPFINLRTCTWPNGRQQKTGLMVNLMGVFIAENVRADLMCGREISRCLRPQVTSIADGLETSCPCMKRTQTRGLVCITIVASCWGRW